MMAALRLRLPGETGQDLMAACLEDAVAVLKGYCGRTDWPEGLDDAAVRLAVVFYGRLGAEGESARREGDIERTFSALPEDIKAQARPYRLARTV